MTNKINELESEIIRLKIQKMQMELDQFKAATGYKEEEEDGRGYEHINSAYRKNHLIPTLINNLRLVTNNLINVLEVNHCSKSMIFREYGLVNFHVGRIDGFIDGGFQLSEEEINILKNFRKTLDNRSEILEREMEE